MSQKRTSSLVYNTNTLWHCSLSTQDMSSCLKACSMIWGTFALSIGLTQLLGLTIDSILRIPPLPLNVTPMHDADGKVALPTNILTNTGTSVSIIFSDLLNRESNPGPWIKSALVNRSKEDFPVWSITLTHIALLPLKTRPYDLCLQSCSLIRDTYYRHSLCGPNSTPSAYHQLHIADPTTATKCHPYAWRQW